MKHTKQYIAVIPRKGLGKSSPEVLVVVCQPEGEEYYKIECNTGDEKGN